MILGGDAIAAHAEHAHAAILAQMKYEEDERGRIVLERGYRHTRQARKRYAFRLYFREITAQYGGEARSVRRAIAWAKARRFRET